MLDPVSNLIERAKIWYELTGREIEVVIGDLAESEVMRGLFYRSAKYQRIDYDSYTGISEIVTHQVQELISLFDDQ